MAGLDSSALLGLGVTGLLFLVSSLLAKYCGRKASTIDVLVLLWLFWDLALHLSFEVPLAVIAHTVGSVEQSDHVIAKALQEYGKADKRWLTYDPTLIALILGRVALTTPLILTLVYAISTNKYYRHYVQTVHCVVELYAGWMTFGPEWLIGSPNLVTDNWLFFWVYFVFFNGIYIIVPFAMCCQSFLAMKECFPEKKKSSTSKSKKRR